MGNSCIRSLRPALIGKDTCPRKCLNHTQNLIQFKNRDKSLRFHLSEHETNLKNFLRSTNCESHSIWIYKPLTAHQNQPKRKGYTSDRLSRLQKKKKKKNLFSELHLSRAERISSLYQTLHLPKSGHLPITCHIHSQSPFLWRNKVRHAVPVSKTDDGTSFMTWLQSSYSWRLSTDRTSSTQRHKFMFLSSVSHTSHFTSFVIVIKYCHYATFQKLSCSVNSYGFLGRDYQY